MTQSLFSRASVKALKYNKDFCYLDFVTCYSMSVFIHPRNLVLVFVFEGRLQSGYYQMAQGCGAEAITAQRGYICNDGQTCLLGFLCFHARRSARL